MGPLAYAAEYLPEDEPLLAARANATDLGGTEPVLPAVGANVYDILRRDTLVLTREAVRHLEARLK